MIGAFSGDWHYGLSVEELDRTPDVHKAVMLFVDEVIKREVSFVSIGGDLTDNNTPLPDHIALLIQALNKLEDAEIPTFITRGNHCSISAPGRRWGLTPLEHVGYKNVYFITDPKLIKFEDITFLFLPHVTKQQAIEAGMKTAQEFINARAEELLEKAQGKVTVISHYNVDGCKAGTEHLMLRQTDLQLPGVVQRSSKVIKIINSHIHTAQERGKIIMPGSLICTDFGDLDAPKGFLLGDYGDEKWEFEQVLSSSSPMQMVELNFAGATVKEISDTTKKAVGSIERDAIVKVRVLINEENVPLVNFDKLREEISKRARFVKQIDRIITRKRQVRDVDQKVGMSPIDAVKRYLEFRKPEGADRKLELAQRFLANEEVKPKDIGPEFLSKTAADDELESSLKTLAEQNKKPPKPKPVKATKAPVIESEFDELGSLEL